MDEIQVLREERAYWNANYTHSSLPEHFHRSIIIANENELQYYLAIEQCTIADGDSERSLRQGSGPRIGRMRAAAKG
jgi:hypothetical protein